MVALALAPGAAAQEAPTLLAAGDVANCTGTGDEATAALLLARPGVVATLGDNTQESGSFDEFTRCYHPSWGQVLPRTRPSIGNHEYQTPGAAGYWTYFGSAAGEWGKGWYSYDVGSWHVVVLNSNCTIVGCGRGSEQEAWLRADLAASRADCTVAYWHHPLFSSGPFAQIVWSQPFWDALYEFGADVVLSAHTHIYERHVPQAPSGDPRNDFGIRQFVVGTGGHSHSALFEDRLPTSAVANNDTFGVLELTLGEGSYGWRFLPEAGKTFTDSGTGTCHGPPPDRTPPTVALGAPAPGTIVRGPQALAATAADDGAVDRVEFTVSRQVVARDDAPPYELTWDSRTFPDGRRLVAARAVDGYGNVTTSEASEVVIDNAPPDTTLRRAPAVDSRFRTATFGFVSEPGATFDCSLDGAPLRPCVPLVRLADLRAGRHEFVVRARDAAGNPDPTPARYAWRVDYTTPATTLRYSSTPRGAGGEATFRFAASELRTTFACSVDEGPWAPCTSPYVLPAVPAGLRSFRVRASDRAGNVDWIPASRNWRVARRASGFTITGWAGADKLVGTSGHDVIDGGGGADVLRGFGGNDSLSGGSGGDVLDGGPGNDRIVGGTDGDRLLGSAGRDFLDGRDGGRDTLLGGPGRDRAVADRRLDRLRAIEARRLL